ncbi:hypothetical protein [Salinarchaeum sp. IM2453]|uniref:hypothetical protein n=1 Tax=Salinarchaeum sp. IM2453 TaxID=2862870 RepID=UPI002102983D|nr:hypothetical protein [Salinarchaeum sp. IM2453]
MSWKTIPTRALPPRRQRTATRIMQAILLGLLVHGLYTGAPKTITNAGIGLVITFLPAIIRRNYRFVLSPFLTLWITAAVFFHSLGSAGLYAQIEWWDHLTHTLSASVVAAIGYVTVRIIDLHHDEIHLPRRFIFAYIIIFVMAFGVIWELFEFGLDVFADQTGLTMPLAQLGLEDTVVDMMYNTLGAIIVATLGQAYLSGVSKEVRTQLFGTPENPEDGVR